eukprot:9399-Heterococcus_DN1.PRE.1
MVRCCALATNLVYCVPGSSCGLLLLEPTLVLHTFALATSEVAIWLTPNGCLLSNSDFGACPSEAVCALVHVCMKRGIFAASLLLSRLCSAGVWSFSTISSVVTARNWGALRIIMSSPKRRKLDANSNESAATSVQCSSCKAEVSQAVLCTSERAEVSPQSACTLVSIASTADYS